jgi:cyclophilin family peptidyl-prolyl cis-trans isomerase/protein-disulfide isomerase
MKKATLIVFLLVLSLVLGACTATETPTIEVVPDQSEETLDMTSIESEGPPPAPACSPNPPRPQPSEKDLADFTPDPETDWIKGPEDAAITIVEYADFQCPYCSFMSQNLKILREMYPDDVRVVYRHFPLVSIHDKAIPATQAAEAAGLQSPDAFWLMHDLLYETQEAWSGFSVEDFEAWVVEMAGQLGLDTEQFQEDYTSEEIVALAEKSFDDAQALGINYTPYLKINSIYELEMFQGLPLPSIIEWIKLEEKQFSECPPMTVDPESEYLATVVVEGGEFVIKLFPDVAPLAVNNFIFLAENRWYDGVRFFRVLEDFMAQTGDPTNTGIGNPGYLFDIEVTDDLVFDRAGLVGMANSGPANNGSQFFITFEPYPSLNGGYTIFGEVVEGMDVVRSITLRDPQSGGDLPPGDTLISITIEEN